MSARAKRRHAAWCDLALHDLDTYWFLDSPQWNVMPVALDEFMRTERFVLHRKEWC